MAASATVTGKMGPGSTLTSVPFTGVTQMNVNTAQSVLTLFCDQGVKDIDIFAASTFTVTKVASTNNYTVTIS